MWTSIIIGAAIVFAIVGLFVAFARDRGRGGSNYSGGPRGPGGGGGSGDTRF